MVHFWNPSLWRQEDHKLASLDYRCFMSVMSERGLGPGGQRCCWLSAVSVQVLRGEECRNKERMGEAEEQLF